MTAPAAWSALFAAVALLSGLTLGLVLCMWRSRRPRHGQALPAGLGWYDLASVTGEWFWATDSQGRLRYVSDPEDWGLGEDWLGRRLVEFFGESQRESLNREFTAVIHGGSLVDYRLTQPSGQGEGRMIEISARPWVTPAGRVVGIMGTARDVSSLVADGRAAEAVRDVFDSFLEHLPVFYFRLDSQGHLGEIAGCGAQCLERDPTRLIGRSARDLFPGVGDYIDDALSGRYARFESQGVNQDRLWWISACLLPMDDGGVMGLAIDVTESKTAEVKMVGLVRENRALARRLVEVQEEERNTLSRELHDELGQSLTAIRTLATAIAHSGSRKPEDISELGSSIVDLSARLYDVVRNLMHRLRPDVVDGLGFQEALQTCIDNAQLEAMGINLHVEIDDDLDDLSDVLKISLYRILQESLTNIAKYAMASNVSVRLGRRRPGPGVEQDEALFASASSECRDCVDLVIRDDGVGIDNTRQSESDTGRRGSGLRGIRERVHALGGEISIESAPGRGVRIHSRIDASVARQVDGGRQMPAS